MVQSKGIFLYINDIEVDDVDDEILQYVELHSKNSTKEPVDYGTLV